MSPAPGPSPTPSRLYRGVRLEPDGRWAAHVSEGELKGTLIGHFSREALAALAHDRVAIVLGAPLVHGRVNFPPSFSDMELLFLRRRLCTVESVLRAHRDDDADANDRAFEGFLYDEFAAYRCGEAGQETARAVAQFAAREGLVWRRGEATRRFVFGHINPVLCSSWVERFHEGDPNRAYFTCEEAHLREAARRAAEREAAAAAQKVVTPLDGAEPAERREEERPAPESSPPVEAWCVPKPWSSIKRWLRWTCSDEQRELQAPLLQVVKDLVRVT